MKRHLIAIIAIFFLALGACTSSADTDRVMNRSDLIRSINDNRGKVIVINFFASWCPPCREEIPDLMKLREHYSTDDVLIMGLSLDETYQDFSNFSNSVGFNYDVYHATADAANAYRISAIPAMVMYDRQGRQVMVHEGLLTSSQMRSAIDDLISR